VRGICIGVAGALLAGGAVGCAGDAGVGSFCSTTARVLDGSTFQDWEVRGDDLLGALRAIDTDPLTDVDERQYIGGVEAVERDLSTRADGWSDVAVVRAVNEVCATQLESLHVTP
jgi:hypothetical protein